MADEMNEIDFLSSLNPVPGISGNPGPPQVAPAMTAAPAASTDGDVDLVIRDLVTIDSSSAAPTPRRRYNRVLALVAVLSFACAAALLSSGMNTASDNTEIATEEEADTDDADDIDTDTDLDTDAAKPTVAPAAAAPIELLAVGDDAIESLLHPVVAEPFEGLNDADRVRLTGANFPANDSLLIVQCWLVGETGSVDTCDITNVSSGTTQPGGTFEATAPVRRYMSIGGELKDCAESVVGSGCYLAVSSSSNYNESGVTPIFFSPDGEAVEPPVMSADVTEDLQHGDEIVVTGSGFNPGEELALVQCAIGGATGVTGCSSINPSFAAVADAEGNIAVTMPVRRTVFSVEGVVDCAAITCHLLSTRIPSTSLIPLEFDSSSAPVVPDVTVNNTTDLVDDQLVNVSAFDLEFDGGWLIIRQCVEIPEAGLVCSQTFADVEIVNGVANQDVRVSRTIAAPWIQELPIDCAVAACSLRVTASGAELVSVPLTFDPEAPFTPDVVEPAPTESTQVLSPSPLDRLIDGAERVLDN